MTQSLSTPSLDGKSAQFWVGGNIPYASALWWKQLTPQPQATHFIYDLYFYLDDPTSVQALEFDINQSVNGRKYIFGHECNVAGDQQWDVWDTANQKWIPTGITCTAPAAFVWHHLTLEVERLGTQTHFLAITLDGTKSYVERSFDTFLVDATELNVAVQLDENYRGANYSMWVDKVSLQYN
jgi:hypothetical protein